MPPREIYSLPKSGSPYERVQDWLQFSKTAVEEGYTGHDRRIPQILHLESVTFEPTAAHPHDARTVFSFDVPEDMCNMTGNLHGGAVALIFDMATGTAVMAASGEGFWDTVSSYQEFRKAWGHVSRTLNCTYLRPAPVGTKVFVESRVVHIGKRLAQTTGVMRLGSVDGKIAYTCEHGKVAVGGPGL